MASPVFSNLFLFRSGRRGRRSFALLVMACLAVEIAFVAWIFVPAYFAQERYMEMAASGQLPSDAASVSAVNLVLGLLIGLGRLAVIGAAIVALWAAAAQRAHDIGWSGWSAAWLAVPFVNLYILFVFFARKGEPIENRFGPPQTDS